MTEEKMVKEEKPVDMQHEETFGNDIQEIKETQMKIVDSLQQITSFITKLPKQTYKDDEGNEKEGPLWNLMKKAKGIGAF